MKTTDCCSYELSKALKECGFDEPCYCKWAVEPDGRPCLMGSCLAEFVRSECKGRDVIAPFIWQAQKWLREKKKIDVLVYNCACGYLWEASKVNSGTGLILFDEKGDDKNSGCWTSYDAALSAGLAAALKLIKKGE